MMSPIAPCIALLNRPHTGPHVSPSPPDRSIITERLNVRQRSRPGGVGSPIFITTLRSETGRFSILSIVVGRKSSCATAASEVQARSWNGGRQAWQQVKLHFNTPQ